MKQHIVYIPGLTDRYDPFRRLGLWLWRRPSVAVTLVPMRWEDNNESYESKLSRIQRAIGKYTDREIVLVGESAGGPVAIAAMSRWRRRVDRIVTVCGMNHGTDRVSESLYRKNKAFRDAMLEADRIVPELTEKDKTDMSIIYSSKDGFIAPSDTLIDGVRAYNVKVPLHTLAVGYVLFIRPDLVTKQPK